MRRPLVVNVQIAGGGIPDGMTSCAAAQLVASRGGQRPLHPSSPGGRGGHRGAVVPAAGGKSAGLVPGGGGPGVGGVAVHRRSTGAGRRGTVPRARSAASRLLPPGFHSQFEPGRWPTMGSLQVGVRPARGRLSPRRSRTRRQDAERALQDADRRPPDGAFEKERDTVFNRCGSWEPRGNREGNGTAGQAACACTWLYPTGTYASPLTHRRCSSTASLRATATTARFLAFFPPRAITRRP